VVGEAGIATRLSRVACPPGLRSVSLPAQLPSPLVMNPRAGPYKDPA